MTNKSPFSSLNMIYFVLGSILLALLVLIGMSLLRNNGGTTKVIPNQLVEGMTICTNASKTYRQNSEMSCEALKQLEDGIKKIETELDKLRDTQGNLEKKYEGHDVKLTEWLAFRKGLREQCYIQKEKDERKSGK